MKLNIKFVVIASCALLVACGQGGSLSEKNDLKLLNLSNNVASVKSTAYKAESKFGEMAKGDVLHEGKLLTVFNKKGYIIEKTNFESYDEEIDNKEIRTYSADGKLSDISLYDKRGDLKSRSVYTFTKDMMSAVNNYDADGKLINKILFENDGEHITKQIFYDADGQSLWAYSSKYEKGLNTESIFYDKDGKIENSTRCEYTPNGKLSKLITKELTIEMEYDKWDNPVKIINGKVIERGLQYAKGDVYFYEYTYDSKNNWIKRIEYKGEGKTPESITERTITYF